MNVSENRQRQVPHDLFFQCPLRDQPVYVDRLLLSDPMRSVHRLNVLHGVPVVLHENYRIGSRKRQSKATDMGREQKTINAWIRIERLHDSVSFVGLGSTV